MLPISCKATLNQLYTYCPVTGSMLLSVIPYESSQISAASITNLLPEPMPKGRPGSLEAPVGVMSPVITQIALAL